MFAAAQQLGRLTVIIDYNKWQATGRSNDVMALDSLQAKWAAFGWTSREVDGHNMPSILAALEDPVKDRAKPIAIIAHTVKGKGISFMEDDNNWHYRIPTKEEVAAAGSELHRP
jgi:transketolase